VVNSSVCVRLRPFYLFFSPFWNYFPFPDEHLGIHARVQYVQSFVERGFFFSNEKKNAYVLFTATNART